MKRPRIQLVPMLGLVAAITALAAVDATSAGAATFRVTNTNDSGPGSLRQAVADANLAPGADTISFAETGTITLTSGVIIVNGGNLEILGPGPGLLTVSGNRTSGILAVSPTAALHLSGLTLAAGSAGGGAGGALQSNGGTVVVAGTAFVGNSAFAGGAIENANGGTMTITSSTFRGNSALPGGAISNYRSTLTIVNSTFVGNSAVVGGAIYNLNDATARVTNSTFSGNTASAQGGGALDSTGGTSITVENSIFAGDACIGAIQDGGGNLDWPGSSCPGIAGDPRLGVLTDNGGPTETMALGAGSVAIDAAASAACPPTDQRGVPRPFGRGCDIGAYESDVLDTTPPLITVPAGVVVDATGPLGAVVSYTASADDDVDGPVAVTCTPPSGGTFAIGTTRIACEASDAAGNGANASFDVRVKGADEQLGDLFAAVAAVGPGSSLADKVRDARRALAADDLDEACGKLAAFASEVTAQSSKKIGATPAAELVASAQRIRAVLSC